MAGALTAAAALAVVPAAAQADPPPPALNDLVPSLTFGAAELDAPVAVHVAPNGEILVADSGLHRIDRFSADGTFIDSFDASDSATPLDAPEDVATDADGNIYVADFNNDAIYKFSSTGVFITTFDGSDSPGHELVEAGGVTVHGSTVYVTDTGHDRIETFTTAGAFVSAFGSTGAGNGQLNRPFGIAVDAAGDIYVADDFNSRIEVFNSDGTYKSQFGSTGSGPGQFFRPARVALDGDGNVYVADAQNFRGQKFTAGGSFIAEFGPLDGGTFVFGVAVDGAMSVYLAQQGSESTITRYSPRAEATDATGITSTSATLHGIVRPDEIPTSYQFRWHRVGHGTWHALAPHSADGTGNVPINDVLPDLAANRDYAVRVRAQPTGGRPEISNDITFHTAAAPAAVVGDIGASDVSFDGDHARVNVPITGHGGPSTVTLEYQRDGGPQHTALMRTDDPLTATERTFTRAIKVKPAAHYTYTIKLENDLASARSAVRQFTTP